MNTTLIKADVLQSIIDHSKRDQPFEACGYLAGDDNEITRFYPMTNIDHAEDHFSFDPAEQFQVVRSIRSANLKLKAAYHSHPKSQARPSAEDIRLAFDPNILYVIVSLLDQPPTVRAFEIRTNSIAEVQLQITGNQLD